MRVWPGHSYPLGAAWDGAGVNFAPVLYRNDVSLHHSKGFRRRASLHANDEKAVAAFRLLNITAIIGTGAPRESLGPRFSGRFETQISGEPSRAPSPG
jgi:hypothetical protein